MQAPRPDNPLVRSILFCPANEQRKVAKLSDSGTVYACAVALERNPEVAAWIREAGHEPCSHGWRWEETWRLSREEEAEHIRMAIESIRATVGERPLGWYCRYGPSVHTRELLVEEGGFVYDSDAYNDDLPYFVEASGKKAHRRSLLDDLQ
jgi:peptidoglycan/xylan/chitin deacetylase (PgdA/CDA1 family)